MAIITIIDIKMDIERTCAVVMWWDGVLFEKSP